MAQGKTAIPSCEAVFPAGGHLLIQQQEDDKHDHDHDQDADHDGKDNSCANGNVPQSGQDTKTESSADGSEDQSMSEDDSANGLSEADLAQLRLNLHSSFGQVLSSANAWLLPIFSH